MRYDRSKRPAIPGWSTLRKAVLNRDHYICKACGAKVGKSGRRAHVHHLLGLKSNMVYDLVTLCATCHEVVTLLVGPARRLVDDDSSWHQIRAYALTYILANPRLTKK